MVPGGMWQLSEDDWSDEDTSFGHGWMRWVVMAQWNRIMFPTCSVLLLVVFLVVAITICIISLIACSFL